MADSSGMRAGLKGNVDEALRLFAMEAEWGGLNLDETGAEHGVRPLLGLS
jgi:hypothetical protein